MPKRLSNEPTPKAKRQDRSRRKVPQSEPPTEYRRRVRHAIEFPQNYLEIFGCATKRAGERHGSPALKLAKKGLVRRFGRQPIVAAAQAIEERPIDVRSWISAGNGLGPGIDIDRLDPVRQALHRAIAHHDVEGRWVR